MDIDYVEVVFTNRAGTQKALYSTSAGSSPLVGLEFDLARNGGCGDLKMTVARNGVQGTIACGYLVSVNAIVGSTSTRYWHGSVTRIPKTGSTEQLWVYEAKGLWDEFGKQVAVSYYTGADIDDVVTTVKAEFDSPVTAISTSTTEISVASPYTVADIEIEYESPAELLKQLAILQDDVQYGVDQNGKLYFKDIVTTDYAHYVVGTHVAQLDVKEDADTLVNDVYVQSKVMVGGGQLTLHASDATSITAYGTRSKVVQLRNTKSADDAIQYMNNIVSQNKDPKERVVGELPPFSNFIFPRGQVRIIDTDSSVYHFPIQRVKYRLDKEAGLTGSMEVGAQPQPKLEEQMLEIVRRVERAGSNSISLTQIEHTKGEEFAQESIVDGRKNGFLNHFTDTLDTPDKTFDMAKSMFGSQSFYQSQIVGPFGYDFCRAVSNAIPCGTNVPDIVRLHTYTSELGRINFGSDSDFDMFFESATADWRVLEGGHGAENFQGTAGLYYREGGGGAKGTPWALPANHSFRFRFSMQAVNTGRPMLVYWGRTDANNWNLIEIDMSDSTHLRVVLKKHVGLTATTLETITTAISGVGDDVVIQVLYGSISTQYTVKIYQDDEVTLLATTAAYTLACTSGSRIVLYDWYNATDGPCATLVWFEPQQAYIGNHTVYLSRNDGATWTAASIPTIASGREHVNVDISAQTDGTTLRALIITKHPGRVLGWGVSF